MSIEVAVVGNGGREFELGRQLCGADEVAGAFFLDGNAGTADLPNACNVPLRPTALDDIGHQVRQK